DAVGSRLLVFFFACATGIARTRAPALPFGPQTPLLITIFRLRGGRCSSEPRTPLHTTVLPGSNFASDTQRVPGPRAPAGGRGMRPVKGCHPSVLFRDTDTVKPVTRGCNFATAPSSRPPTEKDCNANRGTCHHRSGCGSPA